MKNDFPYREFEKTRVWKVLSRGIKDLEANGDLEEKTPRKYIVGYLAKLIHEAGLAEAASQGAAEPAPNPLNLS